MQIHSTVWTTCGLLRGPVVLAPEDAVLWMDNDLPAEQAEHLARSIALPTDAFNWYEVDTSVNRVGSNDPSLITPLKR